MPYTVVDPETFIGGYPQTPAFTATSLTPHYRNGANVVGQFRRAQWILAEQIIAAKYTYLVADLSWSQTASFTSTTFTTHYRNGSNLNGQFKFHIILLTGAATAISVVTGAALSIDGFSPTVSVWPGAPVPLPTGSLTLTGLVPTPSVWNGANLTVPVGSLSLTGFVPTPGEYSGTSTTPGHGTLTLTGFVPVVTFYIPPVTITVPTGSLVITGHQIFFPTNVHPPVGSLTITTFTPTIVKWNGLVIGSAIPFHTLKLKGYPPVVKEYGKGLTLYIDGVDRTKYLMVEGAGMKAQPCQIQSQTLGRWNASFDIFCNDRSFTPSLDHTIRVTDWGNTVFSGVFEQIITERFMSSTDEVVFHCTALDRSSLCDHRLVGKTYTQAMWLDAAAVVNDIVTNFLDGEGIEVFSVPPLGPLNADLAFNYCTVSSAFDQIAQMAGVVWWVDSISRLYFSSFADLVATPFNLTETSKNWRNLTVTTTTRDYYNRLYAVGNRYVPPALSLAVSTLATVQETFIFTAGQPGVFLNSDGVAAGIRTSLAIGAITSMTVNGHPQTTYDFLSTAPLPTVLLGPNDNFWTFGDGNNQVSVTYPPVPGSVVIINYVQWTPSSAGATTSGLTSVSLAATSAPLSGTLGSGIFEGALQVSDFTTLDDLNAAAQAELARINGLPFVIDYETDSPGLQPGQVQNVNIPLSGVTNKNILITQVTGMFYPIDLGTATGLTTHGSFRWTVEGRSNLDPGAWIKWYERLHRRTANALPLPDYEECTFVLGTNSSVSSGVNITNPYIASRSGALFEVLIAASTPSATASLTFQFTCMHASGGSSFNLLSVTFPAGMSANQLFTWSVAPAVVINKGDVLNVNTIYSIGGDPASGVTCKLRWQTPSSNL